MKTMFKYLSILFVFCLVSIRSIGQNIPNSGFENWYEPSVGRFDYLPSSWSLISGGVVRYDSTKVWDKIAYSGKYSLILINTSEPAILKSTFPYKGRPSRFSFYFKYCPYSNLKPKPWAYIDRFEVEVVLFSTVNGKRKNVAYKKSIYYSEEYTGYPMNEWSKYSIQLDYLLSIVPDSASITFRPTSTGAPATSSAQIVLDELKFEGGEITSVKNENSKVSQTFFFPNPTSGKGVIVYTVMEPTNAIIEIFNTTGQLISQQHQSHETSGTKQLPVSLLNLPPGFYIYRITAANSVSTGKILLSSTK
jgi:hypothetical protein